MRLLPSQSRQGRCQLPARQWRQSPLPVAETDGLAEHQPRDHPAQQSQVALVTGRAVLTEKVVQPTMETDVGIHEGLDWCEEPEPSRFPAHPMI